MSKSINEKEEMLLQAVKTQSAILRLLENTLYDTYKYQKGLPVDERNDELMKVAERARTIIAKKPRLKEIYRKLEEEYGVEL